MRQVVLNDKYYPIEGTIIRRNINPWTAKMSMGDPTYADVTQGNLKEWHDFRGGIGLESELSAEVARLWWSEGVNTGIEKCLIMGPKVTTAGNFNKACVNIFDFLGKTYAYGDALIAEWNASTGAWVSKNTALLAPISHCVITDETATYAVVSSATAAVYTTDGSNWSSLTGMRGHLAVKDHRLCGLVANTLYFSPYGDIDGTIETKKFSAYLGDVHGMFQGKLLTTGEPVLYVNSNEGLWALDFWTKQIYKMEVSYPSYTDAGKTGIYWNSYVWIATGPGIKRITPTLTSDVGPDQDDGLPYGYQGVVYDMQGGTDWLVFCVNGGTSQKSSIFRRHGTLGGNHQIYTTATNVPIRCIHLSPSSIYARGRLWWGEDTGIKYCDFPDFTANPMEVNGYKYDSDSPKCIFPIFRPLAVIPKVALRLQPLTENCREIDLTATPAEGRYVTVYYDIFDGNGWVKADDFETSPLPSPYEFGAGKGTQFYRIKFGVELHSDDDEETPKMESLMFTWMPRPDRMKAWQFTVVAKADSAERTFEELATAEETRTLIDFYPSGDKTKTCYQVVVTSLPSNIYWDTNKQEGHILVTVEEVFKG